MNFHFVEGRIWRVNGFITDWLIVITNSESVIDNSHGVIANSQSVITNSPGFIGKAPNFLHKESLPTAIERLSMVTL